MTTTHHRPPTADEIERLFEDPVVQFSRPVLLASVEVLKFVRRFGWETQRDRSLDELDGPVIFAANHQSHVDTAAILGSLPHAVRERTAVAAALDVFGARESTLRRRLLPITVAAGFHAFAFDREGPPLRSVRTAVQLVRNGWSLLVYPEGTRSRTGDIGPFKAGVGVIARFAGRPVIPVHVSGGREILPRGRMVPRSGCVQVRFGAPLRHDGTQSAASFADQIREEVRRLSPRPTPFVRTDFRVREDVGQPA